MSYLLVVKDGPQSGIQFPLHTGENTIGRGRDNDITLRDEEVSREHAKLILTDSEFRLQDLNSSNGTIFNSRRIDSTPLELGNTFQVGKSVLQLSKTNPDSKSDPSTDKTFKSKDRVAFDNPLAVTSNPGVVANKTDALATQFIFESASDAILIDPSFRFKVLELLLNWLPACRAIILRRNETGEFLPEEVRFAKSIHDAELMISQDVVNLSQHQAREF